MTLIINPVVQQASLSINAETFGGSLPHGINSSLIELKYSYPDFNQDDLSSFEKGQIVVFSSDITATSNKYNCIIEKAETSKVSHANKTLMAFVQYTNNTLILMHKGYLDFSNLNGPLSTWEVGKTIYANNSKISTISSSVGGHWVKSIGFCVPNSESTNRIWFESDSTYLILT